MISMEEKLAKALSYQGGLYTLKDIMERLEDGRMQSFAEGDTWVITQIVDYPQKTALNIFLVVGNLDEAIKAEERIVAFAKEINADLITAFGRPGWKKMMHGSWKHRYSVFDRAI